jgi:phage anti-repressor protein
MEDTMRDLLSKLDAIVSETELKNPEDLQAKRKALQDLQLDPVASSDPEIKQAIIQRKADLEREAKSKGFEESFKIDREELKPAHDKGYGDAAKGIDKNPFNPDSPAFKSYREGQMAYKRSFGEGFEIGDEFGISFSEDHEIATTIVDILEDGIVIELDNTALEMLANEGLTFLEGEVVNEEKQKGVDGKACWKGYKRMGTKQKGGKTVDNCVKMEDHYMPPDHPANKSEYDDEGSMAKDQMRMINDAAQELYKLLDAEENLPEWVQKKIVLAVDYLDTARDYMKTKKYGEDQSVDEAEYQGRKVSLGKPMAGDVKKSKVYVKNPQGRVVKVNFGDKKMRIKKSNPNRRKSFRARHNCANPGPRHKARYWSCRAW